MYANIHVAVVETSTSPSRPLVALRQNSAGFRDLVPWADPYIAGLVSKLERSRAYGQQLLHEMYAEAKLPLADDWCGSSDFEWRSSGNLNG